jgi:uracil-DNA glycosylase family protein
MDQPDRPGAGQWLPEHGGIEQLRAAARSCRGCELWRPATQVVFSSGPPDAAVVMVGEQPGDAEDAGGEPFVGPAGRLLRRAIAAAGLAEQDIYLTNAVKHFRFTERGRRRLHQRPDLAHLVACRPWLAAELAEVPAQVVVLLGAVAARSVLGPGVKVTQERGRVLQRPTPVGDRPVLLTVHPSAVLRARGEAHTEAYDALVTDLRAAAAALG